jgi:hypothetical protein
MTTITHTPLYTRSERECGCITHFQGGAFVDRFPCDEHNWRTAPVVAYAVPDWEAALLAS